ncbi:Neurotrypsin [Holothuria leucospilota]|uniref:Neurotrypsin n=1 Tax=Holothuria leucospilota TaxID=206669 RepID=A0A9Q1BTS0_HOLLE|nr:Neurotrypsin [Holothuria leucospilota]
MLIPLLSAGTGNSIQDVRLAGGPSSSSGRIEVLFNREWRTVCDDGWNLTKSNVVCRQLGYQAAVVTYRSGFFGEGSAFIRLDELECIGNESALLECKQENISGLDCNLRQDAGVLCGSKNVWFEYIPLKYNLQLEMGNKLLNDTY